VKGWDEEFDIGRKMKTLVTAALLLVALSANADATRDLSGLEDQCRRNVKDKCRQLALARQIDDALFSGDRAKYIWVLGPQAIASIVPTNAIERRQQLKQAACSYLAEVWVNDIISEYGRITDSRAVDRRTYNACMSGEY
jgi:hypothetical protein